ncbi:MAG: WD40 repeat domain-containing protein [Planctomycetota bacterium]|nr:WD40 repeat domain-containing protein [Planctomycetota bacterium]MDA1177538.1 WD40 repeat domain-containing protein [Planctomycetota bacterium]
MNRTIVAFFVASVLHIADRLPADERQGDLQGSGAVVTCLATDPRGNLIVSGGDDHEIRIWSRDDGSMLARYRKHHDWIQDIRFSPSGEHFASTGKDGLLLVWDSDGDGKCRTIAHSKRYLQSLDFDPQGKYLVVAGASCDVQVYDTTNWREMDPMRHSMPCPDVRCVRFSPKAGQIAACSRIGHVHLWDLNSGNNVPTILGSKRDRSQCLAFSWDGEWLAVGGEDREIRLWHLSSLDGSPEPTNVLSLGNSKVLSLSFVGAQLLAVGGSDNRIRIWDIAAGDQVRELTGHTGSVSTLAFASQSLISGSYDTTLRFWSDSLFETNSALMARIKVTSQSP